MARTYIKRPVNVEKYTKAEVKLYKAFINYLRFRKVVGQNEFLQIPRSEAFTFPHGETYVRFADIDAFEGLGSYDWRNLQNECKEFFQFLSTINVGAAKLGYKNICAKLNLNYDLVKLGIKRYRFYIKEVGAYE